MAAKHFSLAIWPLARFALFGVVLLSAAGLVAWSLKPYGVEFMSGLFFAGSAAAFVVGVGQLKWKLPDWLTGRCSWQETLLSAVWSACLGLMGVESIRESIKVASIPIVVGALYLGFRLRKERQARERLNLKSPQA